ncbi:hypothetical protein RCR19_39410 [Streptomyces sp. WAC07094]|uniref:hypothetical protein n=1 Tax=Streptomyces sp. WAC07094 TaxID=3072183 RepID=UPI002EA36A4E|nr:hypothetical protein [Streptomyces sp. WAC07094]
MSQSTTAATGLSSQYAAQVTSDLERNVKEQERISTDIAALQQELTSLQSDHSVLVNVQQALGITSAPAQSAATPEATTVPAPREKTSAEPSTGKRARAKKTDAPATDKKPAAQKTASKSAPKPAAKSAPKAAAKSAPKAAGKAETAKAALPTLVELIRRHLTEQSEPRSAAEVSTALDQAHPERGIKTTVVRTTLENLVARTQAHRSKQGSSVYYTAPTQQDTAPKAEAAQAEESK